MTRNLILTAVFALTSVASIPLSARPVYNGRNNVRGPAHGEPAFRGRVPEHREPRPEPHRAPRGRNDFRRR